MASLLPSRPHNRPPMAPIAHRLKRVFQRHDKVEVSSKEQGFIGSYYTATVIANMGDNYVVEYENLVEDDEITPLKETVMASALRPPPPNQSVISKKAAAQHAPNGNKIFRYGDVVDAFDNDGWWKGVVTGKKGRCYSVFFEPTLHHIAYQESRLRPHLGFLHGKWVPCKNKKAILKNHRYVTSEWTASVLEASSLRAKNNLKSA